MPITNSTTSSPLNFDDYYNSSQASSEKKLGQKSRRALGAIAESNLTRPPQTNAVPLAQTYYTAATLKNPGTEKNPTELLHIHKRCFPVENGSWAENTVMFFTYGRSKVDDFLTFPFREPHSHTGCGSCYEVHTGGQPRPFIEPIIGFTAGALGEPYPFVVPGTFNHGMKYRYRVTDTRITDFFYEDPFFFVSGKAPLVQLEKCEKPIEAYARMTDWYRTQYEHPESSDYLRQVVDGGLSFKPMMLPKKPEEVRLVSQTVRFSIPPYLNFSIGTTHWAGLGGREMPHPTQGNLLREPVRVMRYGEWAVLKPNYNRPMFDDASLSLKFTLGKVLGPGFEMGTDFGYLGWPEGVIDPNTHDYVNRFYPYIGIFNRFQ